MKKFFQWRPNRRVVLIIFGGLIIIGILTIIIGGYYFNWAWTGLHTKTLWDWIQLLGISAVISIFTYWFNITNAETQRAIAEDNQREAALQKYIDEMSKLLLEKSLSQSNDDEVRKVARTRTISVLHTLDSKRLSMVFAFLRESGLNGENNIIIDFRNSDLRNVDFSNVDMSKVNLMGANLQGANLSGAMMFLARLSTMTFLDYADLSDADLTGAYLRDARLEHADLRGARLGDAFLRGARLSDTNLSKAYLSGTDLSEAYLNDADLSEANLWNAKVTQEQLEKAKSLKGAIMPDGTKHK